MKKLCPLSFPGRTRPLENHGRSGSTKSAKISGKNQIEIRKMSMVVESVCDIACSFAQDCPIIAKGNFFSRLI